MKTKATSTKKTKTSDKKTSVKTTPKASAETAVARMASADEVANQGQGVTKVPVPPMPKLEEKVDLTDDPINASDITIGG